MHRCNYFYCFCTKPHKHSFFNPKPHPNPKSPRTPPLPHPSLPFWKAHQCKGPGQGPFEARPQGTHKHVHILQSPDHTSASRPPAKACEGKGGWGCPTARPCKAMACSGPSCAGLVQACSWALPGHACPGPPLGLLGPAPQAKPRQAQQNLASPAAKPGQA